MPCTSTEHTIEIGDSRELSSLSDESVDLVVTSPPYPMIEMWDALFRRLDPEIRDLAGAPGVRISETAPLDAYERMHRQLDRVWGECYRCLRPGGGLCINIGDATRTIDGRFRLYPNHARIVDSCVEIGFDTLPIIFWQKPTNAPNKFMGSGMYPPGAYPTLEHEYILVFRKGGKRIFSSPEARRTRRESAYFWEERNVWFSDFWQLKGSRQSLAGSATRERSGAFPLELAFRLVSMFSVRADTVLDPFLGTGTTLLAAALGCRNSIGIEIDPGLGEEAAARLRGSSETLRRYQLARVDRHLAFAEERRLGGKPCKYRNEPHGFPVVTRQECDLRIDVVNEVAPIAQEESGFGLSVDYRPYGQGSAAIASDNLSRPGDLAGLFDTGG